MNNDQQKMQMYAVATRAVRSAARQITRNLPEEHVRLIAEQQDAIEKADRELLERRRLLDIQVAQAIARDPIVERNGDALAVAPLGWDKV